MGHKYASHKEKEIEYHIPVVFASQFGTFWHDDTGLIFTVPWHLSSPDECQSHRISLQSAEGGKEMELLFAVI